MNIIDLSTPEGIAECKIDEVVSNLFKRIAEETEKYLREQLGVLGVDTSDTKSIDENCIKVDFPGDPKRLCSYFYKGRLILAVKIADNMMAVEFETPNLEGETS